MPRLSHRLAVWLWRIPIYTGALCLMCLSPIGWAITRLRQARESLRRIIRDVDQGGDRG